MFWRISFNSMIYLACIYAVNDICRKSSVASCFPICILENIICFPIIYNIQYVYYSISGWSVLRFNFSEENYNHISMKFFLVWMNSLIYAYLQHIDPWSMITQSWTENDWWCIFQQITASHLDQNISDAETVIRKWKTIINFKLGTYGGNPVLKNSIASLCFQALN